MLSCMRFFKLFSAFSFYLQFIFSALAFPWITGGGALFCFSVCFDFLCLPVFSTDVSAFFKSSKNFLSFVVKHWSKVLVLQIPNTVLKSEMKRWIVHQDKWTFHQLMWWLKCGGRPWKLMIRLPDIVWDPICFFKILCKKQVLKLLLLLGRNCQHPVVELICPSKLPLSYYYYYFYNSCQSSHYSTFRVQNVFAQLYWTKRG